RDAPTWWVPADPGLGRDNPDRIWFVSRPRDAMRARNVNRSRSVRFLSKQFQVQIAEANLLPGLPARQRNDPAARHLVFSSTDVVAVELYAASGTDGLIFKLVPLVTL